VDLTLGDYLSPWLVLPFAGMLACIAVLPLATPTWFERLRNKALVAAVFGVPVVLYLVLEFDRLGRHTVLTTAEDYFSFIVLLLALFAISGGIYLAGDPLGTPRNNLTFLGVGALRSGRLSIGDGRAREVCNARPITRRAQACEQSASAYTGGKLASARLCDWTTPTSQAWKANTAALGRGGVPHVIEALERER
jgi:hypothetical protein